MSPIEWHEVQYARHFPGLHSRVVVEIEGMAPESLPMPNTEVRWHIAAGGGMGYNIHLAGQWRHVREFIVTHWDEETAETIRFGAVGVQG